MLLVSSVVAGSLALQLQTGGPPVQAAVPRESVKSHSRTSSVAKPCPKHEITLFERPYRRGQLNPEFAEAYNNRGFAYYLSGNAGDGYC